MEEESQNQKGINLVDEYFEITTKFKELKKEQERLKENLIRFAKESEKEIISGTLMNTKFKEIKRVVLPEDRIELIKIIKDRGVYENYSMLSYSKINSKFLKGEIEEDIKNALKIKKNTRFSLSKK